MIFNLQSKILRSLRDQYKKKYGIKLSDFKSNVLVSIEGQHVSDKISESILSGRPFLLSRFGSEEIKWYVNYKLLSENYLSRIVSYVTCNTDSWKKKFRIIDNLTFQPKTIEMTEAFIQAMDNAIPQIDVLGSWLKLEQLQIIQSKLNCNNYAFLLDIEPYYHSKPWSQALKGKKVLVVHPMAKSIQSQYARRHLLFENPLVLPEFSLITLQAKYFDDPLYNTWDKIYNFYLEETSKIEYDIAIIGCGSWGMPLAAELKLRGKIALHLGGATQVLFGITGERWNTQYKGFKNKFINEHWVRPSIEETPTWASNYDKKSYW